MKYTNMLTILLVAALGLAACTPSATEAPAAEVPTSTTMATEAPTQPAMTDTSAAPAVTSTQPVVETATGSVPVTGAATVNVSQDATYGPILVDGEGLSLYIFTSDTQNSGTSACTDAECVAEWPPLLTDGDPVAGEGVDAAMLGTITRDDGSTQVTYNGWPLHHFDEDKAPGDTLGQGMGGLWFLISPDGVAVQQ